MSARTRPILQQLPFQFSLHVRHPSADPKVISRELRLTATESFKAGEPRASRSGVAATAVHGETYWVAVVDPMVWSLPEVFLRRTGSAQELGRSGRGQRTEIGGEPLPKDRRLRFKQLVGLGRSQGCLSVEQIRHYLPEETVADEQLEEVVGTLSDLGISVGEQGKFTRQVLARRRPHHAKVLRTRFGVNDESTAGSGDLGLGLSLICECMTMRHAIFLRQLREQGGSVTLRVTLSAEMLGEFRLTPELGQQLSDLGLTVRFELLDESEMN